MAAYCCITILPPPALQRCSGQPALGVLAVVLYAGQAVAGGAQLSQYGCGGGCGRSTIILYYWLYITPPTPSSQYSFACSKWWQLVAAAVLVLLGEQQERRAMILFLVKKYHHHVAYYDCAQLKNNCKKEAMLCHVNTPTQQPHTIMYARTTCVLCCGHTKYLVIFLEELITRFILLHSTN